MTNISTGGKNGLPFFEFSFPIPLEILLRGGMVVIIGESFEQTQNSI
jgi:hypothetical protein